MANCEDPFQSPSLSHSQPSLSSLSPLVLLEHGFIRRSYFRREVFGSFILCIMVLVGFLAAIAGISEIPTCPYGDASCFFRTCEGSEMRLVPPFGYDSEIYDRNVSYEDSSIHCRLVYYNARLEDSLTIPAIGAITSILTALLVLIGCVYQRAVFQSVARLLSMVSCLCLIFCSIKIEDATLHCRLNRNSPTREECATGRFLFLGGAVILVISQVCLVIVSMLYTEKKYKFDRLINSMSDCGFVSPRASPPLAGLSGSAESMSPLATRSPVRSTTRSVVLIRSAGAMTGCCGNGSSDEEIISTVISSTAIQTLPPASAASGAGRRSPAWA